MKTKSSLGSQILATINEAIEFPAPGRLRRPKIDVKAIRKNYIQHNVNFQSGTTST